MARLTRKQTHALCIFKWDAFVQIKPFRRFVVAMAQCANCRKIIAKTIKKSALSHQWIWDRNRKVEEKPNTYKDLAMKISHSRSYLAAKYSYIYTYVVLLIWLCDALVDCFHVFFFFFSVLFFIHVIWCTWRLCNLNLRAWCSSVKYCHTAPATRASSLA